MTTSRVSAWALPAGLSRLRPEACGLLTALNERVWQAGDPVLLELIRSEHAEIASTARIAVERLDRRR